MNKEKLFKSNQEQAVAAWADYLNQIRLDDLVEALKKQEGNYKSSIEMLNEALKMIHNDILKTNRGGDDGKHGFIAEIAQYGVENAKRRIEGQDDSIIWVDNNKETDLIRTIKNGNIVEKINIQQKFYQSGDGLSLDAIEKHLSKYPDFLKNGGKYEIPKDQYEKIQYYMNISERDANKMPTDDGTFSMKQWKRVHTFIKDGKIGMDKIEPSEMKYSEVQSGKIDNTINEKKQEIKGRNDELKKEAYDASKPTLIEGAKVTAVSTLIECSTVFVSELIKKIKLRKSIRNLTSEDWKDIATKSGYGAIKGGVRGAVVYGLTNYTATPASMATAIVTSCFGVGENIYKFNKGEFDETTMIEQSELFCLDAVMSAITTLLGQCLIPVPILGAVIGNSVGMMVYSNVKDAYFDKQNKILEEYKAEIDNLRTELGNDYKVAFNEINSVMHEFMTVCSEAFSVDVNEAFDGSIKLANKFGVPKEEILDSRDKISAYFLG